MVTEDAGSGTWKLKLLGMSMKVWFSSFSHVNLQPFQLDGYMVWYMNCETKITSKWWIKEIMPRKFC